MSLEHDLKTLSEAHGPKALASAFQRLQGTIRQTRKAASKTWGLLASSFVAAMKIWDVQKADGVAKREREAALEQTLRLAWPQVRQWKYLCESCRDVGLAMLDCPGDSTCGRGKPHLPHEFGKPCWCSLGTRFREKPRLVPPPPEKRTMTNVGR